MNFRPAVRPAAICLLYWAAALLAAHMAKSLLGATSTAFCQIPGLSLGLLVLCGLGYIPAVFVGELICALLLGHLPGALGVEAAMAAQSTAIFALTAWLVRRKFGPAPVPEDFGQAAVLALAAVAVPFATSILGTALIRAGGFSEGGGFIRTALVHWAGGIAGILTVVPLAAVHIAPALFSERKAPRRGRRRQAAEIAAQAAALAFTLWLVLLAPALRAQHLYFLCFVPLVWIGLRHGLAGTTLAVLVVNFGSLAILRRLGADDAVVANFFLFETALAAMGLGLGAAVDFRDRAEAKLAENEAARMAAERTLLQAQKLESLEVLAGGIAHDFNNLLTVILGNLSLAQMDAEPESAAAACLQQARKAVVRATELCRQMLAYSGKGQFSATLVNLNALVQDTAQLLQVTINRSCSLEFHLDPELAQVRVDPTQIRQIVMNLVINASDAIGDKGGLIRVSTAMRRTADACVALEVADNGCGMTPEVRARVFEPFFTTKFTGRGLGLAAVLGIVRSYGGSLTVESELGKGSTFTLLLPAQSGKGDEAPPVAGAPRADTAKDKGTILVVDDEETVRIVAARLLESHGYTTVLAEDGLDAVNILASRGSDIHAALLDLTMPRMNGAQTLREFRRLRPGFPVVVMSGYSEWESAGRFPGAEPTAMIPKPFDRDVLIARIREAVAKNSG